MFARGLKKLVVMLYVVWKTAQGRGGRRERREMRAFASVFSELSRIDLSILVISSDLILLSILA